jgi:bacterioferritin-associated ferredoxin
LFLLKCAFIFLKKNVLEPFMVVCVCRKVSDRQIVNLIQAGADSWEAVQLETGAGTCCGRCQDCAKAITARALSKQHVNVVEKISNTWLPGLLA